MESLLEEYLSLIESGLAPREGVKALALKYDLPSREVYAIVHETAPTSVK